MPLPLEIMSQHLILEVYGQMGGGVVIHIGAPGIGMMPNDIGQLLISAAVEIRRCQFDIAQARCAEAILIAEIKADVGAAEIVPVADSIFLTWSELRRQAGYRIADR